MFSKQKNYIGLVKDFKLDINLTDEFPVAEAYRKIPAHLYKEVKNHINDHPWQMEGQNHDIKFRLDLGV